jgi:ABC-type glutathione transport system ATPase component
MSTIDPSTARHTLSFSNLSYTVKTKDKGGRRLTDNVSLKVHSGEMVGECGLHRYDLSYV